MYALKRFLSYFTLICDIIDLIVLDNAIFTKLYIFDMKLMVFLSN